MNNSFRKLCIGIVISLLFFYANSGYGQSLGLPFSKFIPPSEYGAGMQNLDIEQDSRGFLYFANNFGLLEFDGSTWKIYPVKEGSKVRSVEISGTGTIYVAAQGEFGYFKPDNNGALKYHSLSADLPEEHRSFDEVWRVFVGNKEVYFCTFTKVFTYFNNKLIDVIPIASSEEFFFPNKRLFAQTNNLGLQRLLNGDFTKVADLRLNIGEEIIAVLPQSEGKLVFISNTGNLYDNSGNQLLDLNKLLNTLTIRASTAIRLRNGDIAIGTEQSGLWIIKESGDIIANLTKGKGLQSSTVIAMQEDLDGNLWVSHNSGLSIIELGLPFTYINEDIGFPGSGYDAFLEGNKIYLSSNYGLFKSAVTSGTLNFSSVTNAKGQSYFVNEQGGIVYVGQHTGGYYIEDGIAKPITTRTGTWIVIRFPNDSKKLIAGTYNGMDLYEITEKGTPTFVKHLRGFEESSRVMEFDDMGYLWMTHGYKGVYRFEFNDDKTDIVNITYFGQESGLPSNELINVYKIENELIFTTINGVYRYNEKANSFYKDSLKFGLKELYQPLNVMASDGIGNIYFQARNSMGVLRKGSSGNYEAEVNTFNKVFNLINDDLSNISVLNSQNILFGGKEGFIVYNPRKPLKTKVAHQSYIREVRLPLSDSVIFSGQISQTSTDKNADSYDERIFPHENNSFQFVFTSNFINDYKKTEYRYYLEGFDQIWTDWNTSTEVRYTNLYEGEYTFRVKARDIYSRESSEASYQFIIAPPWYRSRIAYTGYVISILGSVIFGMAIVDRRHRKSRITFEQAKQQEVDEIGNRLESLTQTTSEEISRLQAEKLEVEVQQKNTELAASTMNLINKNKFITGIKENLNTIKKKSKSDDVKKELSVIMKNIEKNISHDDDWKQFAFHFNNVHGDFTKRLTSEFSNLSSQDIRLCSYLRLNLSTKEIAELLNISVRGVEISRYRLRKKLELERSQNLADFILNY